MPFYNYQCVPCDQTIEVFLIKARPDDALVLCKNCDSPMERQPSAPAFKIMGLNAANGYSKEQKV